MEDASERKQVKYDHLLTTAKRNGFHASLVTLEIGSRWMPHPPGICALQPALIMSSLTLRKLVANVIKTAIEGVVFYMGLEKYTELYTIL